MVSRFDHAVIAVADLDSAIEVYRTLGFDVAPGGRHTGRGTHNAIIRFGLDYLELLAVHDLRLAQAAGGNVSELVGYVDRTGGGALGFALAAADLDAVAASWTSDFAPAPNPLPMERVRPDGTTLSWRLLIPGGSAWRRPWPFLIQWGTPDRDRLSDGSASSHPNGATGVAGAKVLAKPVRRVLPLYERDLGLEPVETVSAALGASFSVDGFRIDLVEPSQSPSLAAAFERDGEGLLEVELAIRSVLAAAAVLRIEPDQNGRLVIPAARACGARIVLSAGSS